MKQLTISLVTYNSARYLPDLCDSLRSQSFTDWDLIVVDNNSFDASAEIMQEHFPQAKVIRQKTNLGFSKAHNLIMRWSKTPYLLVVNPDIVMTPKCIEQLMGAMAVYSDAAEVGGKLLYWDVDAHTTTSVIDSFGLLLSRRYRATDRLQGEPDREMHREAVFGISGALVLLRREALEAVRIARGNGTWEYFDEDFFAYKEDVDLAWRFIIAGWKNYFIPEAIAYHHRRAAGSKAAWQYRKQRSEINRYSYRNHLLMVYKNQFWRVTARYIFPIAWFEMQKFFYLLFLDRSCLRGLAEAIRQVGRFIEKRARVQALRSITVREFKQWLQSS